MSETPALVMIDVQRGLIDGFEDDWHPALEVIGRLGARARQAGVPVFVIQHRGQNPSHPLHRDRPGWALHPVVALRPEDELVEKRWSDAFRDTDLDGRLRARDVTRLVIVGAQTEFCVDATARRALSLGYDVDLVADGHTTSDNEILGREQIIAHHNATLANLAVEGVRLRAPLARDVELISRS
jgi:nicotinamidase-related amidase